MMSGETSMKSVGLVSLVSFVEGAGVGRGVALGVATTYDRKGECSHIHIQATYHFYE